MGDGDYFWVVICKSHGFHKRQNRFFGHKILLGETDSVLPPPAFDGQLQVRCDDCGQQYPYTLKDVVRVEVENPQPFTPHPLFLAGETG